MLINSINYSPLSFEKRRIKFHTGKFHDGYSAVSEKTKKVVTHNKNKSVQNRYEREVMRAYNNDPLNKVSNGIDTLKTDVERLEQEYYNAYMGIDINHKKVSRKKFR